MTPSGSTILPSSDGFEATLQRLERKIAERGVPLLARIDHAESASIVGLSMPPTTLLIFGDARVGTPLMQARPTIAIDLPLKMLVWNDAAGQTLVGYNDPVWLVERHGGLGALNDNLARIGALLSDLARTAAGRDKASD